MGHSQSTFTIRALYLYHILATQLNIHHVFVQRCVHVCQTVPYNMDTDKEMFKRSLREYVVIMFNGARALD